LSGDGRRGKIRLVERKKLQDSYITVLFIVNDMQNLTKKIYAKVWLEFNDPTALTCQMPENFLNDKQSFTDNNTQMIEKSSLIQKIYK
jgi:hypothetical protein